VDSRLQVKLEEDSGSSTDGIPKGGIMGFISPKAAKIGHDN